MHSWIIEKIHLFLPEVDENEGARPQIARRKAKSAVATKNSKLISIPLTKFITL
jgi:hypothetical protein